VTRNATPPFLGFLAASRYQFGQELRVLINPQIGGPLSVANRKTLAQPAIYRF